MNHRFKIAMAALAVLLLAAGLLLTVGGRKEEDITITRVFPPQLDNRLEFHQSKNNKEKVREVKYLPDGITKESAKVTYETGNTGFITYRTAGDGKGTIEKVKVTYPTVAGKPERVARELELDVDGKTYLSDRVLREDGVLQYTGNRTANDKYETFDYRDDGKSIQRHQVFLRLFSTWRLDVEEAYRLDNTVERSVSRRDDGTVITKQFSDKSKLEYRSVANAWGTSTETEYYDADGQTVNKKIELSTYDVTVTTYSNGNMAEARRFYSNYDYMTLTVYDAAGNKQRRQSYRAKRWGDIRTNGKIDGSKYSLSEVEYWDGNGFELRDIDFRSDGITPVDIVLRDPKDATNGSWYYPRTVKQFRQDGTLESVTVYDGRANVTKTETHTAAENIREQLDPADLAQRPIEEPPELMRSPPSSW